MKWLKKYADRLLSLFVGTGVLLLLWFLLQATVVASFRIPTDSMQPTLLPGDNILVNKTLMGARIFNIWDAAEDKEVEIHRLPRLGKVKRNNVLVFHYPYPHKNDSLSMHLLKYYVKRCIALPGDTMGIRKGHYYIKGINEPIGNIEAQKRIEKLQKENARGIVMDTYPWDKYIDWTIQDFGPLHVPARGQTVVMDSTAVKLYRNPMQSRVRPAGALLPSPYRHRWGLSALRWESSYLYFLSSLGITLHSGCHDALNLRTVGKIGREVLPRRNCVKVTVHTVNVSAQPALRCFDCGERTTGGRVSSRGGNGCKARRAAKRQLGI